MATRLGELFLAAVAVGLPAVAAAQGVSAEDANKSNNPLNPAVSLALQDLYTPKLYGSDGHTNDLLARATIPVLPGAAVKVPQIFRVTAPISTRPDRARRPERHRHLPLVEEGRHRARRGPAPDDAHGERRRARRWQVAGRPGRGRGPFVPARRRRRPRAMAGLVRRRQGPAGRQHAQRTAGLHPQPSRWVVSPIFGNVDLQPEDRRLFHPDRPRGRQGLQVRHNRLERFLRAAMDRRARRERLAEIHRFLGSQRAAREVGLNQGAPMRRLFMPILMVVCSIAAAADDPARHAPQIATRIGTLEFTHGFANGYPTEAYFD